MGLFFDTLFGTTQTMTRELGLRIYYIMTAAFRADEIDQNPYRFDYAHAYLVAAKQLDPIVTSKAIQQNVAAIIGDMLTEDRMLGRQNAEERARAFAERFNTFYPNLL